MGLFCFVQKRAFFADVLEAFVSKGQENAQVQRTCSVLDIDAGVFRAFLSNTDDVTDVTSYDERPVFHVKTR